MTRLFGTDGVRGIANSPELLPELAFAVGHVATYTAREANSGTPDRRPLAVVGRDTRRSGLLLEAALTAGVLSAGGDVRLLGVATTPAVAHVTRMLGADFGVVLSASHNPAEYNGIKFFSRDGYKLPDEAEDRLEALLQAAFPGVSPGSGTARLKRTMVLPRPFGAYIGTAEPAAELLERYVDHVVSTVGVRLDGLKVVVDCGHGAAYRLAPEVLRRLGARVVTLGDQPDGMNINSGYGSMHPETVRQAVLEMGADAGICHDGDADRCIAVDARGNLVDGDGIMAICALELQRQGRLQGNAVVATIMSNIGLELFLREHGIDLVRTKVGDRYVLEQMLARQYVLGGEQSGHVIFLEHSTTGDGVLSAVQLLAAMVRSGKPLSKLAGTIQRLPQVLENVSVRRKEGWQESRRIQAALERAEAHLDGKGRVLVRPSGTEPIIRVMIEGPDLEAIRRMAQDIARSIQAELG